MTIPFVDLNLRCPEMRQQLTEAVAKAIDGGQFILGDQVGTFERCFAQFCGATHCIGVGNGTDALHLTLRALGVGPGDEVITAANTFVATALAISYTGATPVLVDVREEDYLIDVELIEQAITPRTKAIVPVHLYGQPADMPAIMEIANRHGLSVVQDACQAHGADINGQPIATFGDAACFSFYPSKNLGAFGDGGAIVTNCERLAEQARMLRNYGQKSKNDFAMLGFNSRLDTVQAAILNVKLPYLSRANEKRRAFAGIYREVLQDCDVMLPLERDGVRHVYHLFVIRHLRRDELLTHLRQAGVECGIHYPTPIHEIPTFRDSRTVPHGAPVATRLAREILSLPMHPELNEDLITQVATALRPLSATLAVA